jgi:hypothetical protein
MKSHGTAKVRLRELSKNIGILCSRLIIWYGRISNEIRKVEMSTYNLCTYFPQKLWKTAKSPVFFNMCLVLLCVALLASCTYMRGSKKQSQPVSNTALISVSEEEVKKALGEPDMVSRTPDNRIIWTYKPKWKILPNNTDTTYVEFENGKVAKILKVR